MTIDPSIFKAYDVRGIFGQNITVEIFEAIGRAYATYLKPKRIVCGRDVRISGLDLQQALMNGIRSAGVEVTDIGLVTTDALYFAVGKHGFDGGAMITASHNPPEWNGVKFTREQAMPLYGDHGIQQIRAIVETGQFENPSPDPRNIEALDIQSEYINHVLSFGQFRKPRKLKIVIDPGNGSVTRFLNDLMSRLPFTWSAINATPDGNFPGRNPNPIAPGALDQLSQTIISTGADLGVAFDADADRMFFMDERGNRVLGDVTTAILAKQFLKRFPGAPIVYNLICSHMVPEEITKARGRPVRSAVGHANMKPIMRREDAPFGGEISGHYFFRDFYYADSGLAAMVAGLDYLSGQAEPLSRLVDQIDVYAHAAEINSTVQDIPNVLTNLKRHYADGHLDEVDGITIEYADWWFNARASNTEPLLRLTVEAKTRPMMEQKRDEVLNIIRRG